MSTRQNQRRIDGVAQNDKNKYRVLNKEDLNKEK